MKPIFLTLFAFLIIALPSHAQSYGQTFESLSNLNSGNPLQDPRFDRIEEILDRNIQDRKNKVVGEVHDVILTSRGNINALTVEFGKLRHNDELTLTYDTTGFQGVSNAYIMSLYDADQINELYPVFLSEMQTASGDGSDTLSAKTILGAKLKANNGKVLGEVTDVLFDRTGDRARALYVNMKIGNHRGHNIAIPFSAGEFSFTNRYKEITLSSEQTRALLDYAETL